MALVLYRKYRPKTFAEIVGQEHVIQTLTNAISSGTVSHAYLFSGSRGTGKTTVARLLAKAVNCQNRKEQEAEPCNQCNSCQEIMAGNSLDIIEIDAASNRGIDEIRALRDGIKFSPTHLKYKVYIIDECHELTKEAFNALLKTLEEPPAHAIFVLATTEIQKVLPTIISRCQRFDFRRLNLVQIVSRLQYIIEKEGIDIEKPVLNLIALNAEGSIRDAESLLDQVVAFGEKKIDLKQAEEILGIVDINIISQFVDYLIKKDAKGGIRYLNQIQEKGRDLQQFSHSLINYLRELLLLSIDRSLTNPLGLGLTDEQSSHILEQAGQFNEKDWERIIKIFIQAQQEIKRTSLPQLPLELAIVEVISQPSNK